MLAPRQVGFGYDTDAVCRDRTLIKSVGRVSQPVLRKRRRVGKPVLRPRITMQLHGIIVPAVTPMTAGEDVDLVRLRATLDRLLAAGVHGLFVLGTTGEFYALDPAEKQTIIAETVALAA